LKINLKIIGVVAKEHRGICLLKFYLIGKVFCPKIFFQKYNIWGLKFLNFGELKTTLKFCLSVFFMGWMRF